MKLLYENEVKNDLSILFNAWKNRETFLILPHPLPVNEEWLALAIEKLPADLREEHFGILTSGSTGTPKLVIGNKGASETLVREIAKEQNLSSVNTTIICLPLSYSYSLINQWLWATTNNKKIIQTEGISSPKQLIDTLVNEDSSMICFVGSQFILFEKYISEGVNFPNVKCVNFAGGVFPQEYSSRLQNLFPNAQIFHNYGCTEAMPRLTIRNAFDFTDPYVLGAPLAGITLKINNESKLIFQSPYSAVAICSPEEIKLLPKDTEIETGDLAEQLPNGFIRLTGRFSEVFKRHGEKISLSSITEKIKEIQAEPFALYQTIDPQGELGYCLVITNEDPKKLKETLIFFRGQFKRAHWPLRIEFIEILPLGSNGKINQSVLKNSNLQLLWKQHI